MAFTKQSIMDWVQQLNLDTWGPVEVNWTDNFHRVHVIVGDGEKEAARQQIEDATAKELAAGTVSTEDAQDFLNHLFVTDYAQED